MMNLGLAVPYHLLQCLCYLSTKLEGFEVIYQGIALVLQGRQRCGGTLPAPIAGLGSHRSRLGCNFTAAQLTENAAGNCYVGKHI